MKKILLPTDFSDNAAKAYPLAAQLAKKHNAEIFLTHLTVSWNSYLATYNIYDDFEIIDASQREFLERAAKKMKDLSNSDVFKGAKVNGEVKIVNTNDSVMEFIELANSEDYDLIVLGTAGTDEKLESFAEIVMRNSHAPVLSCYKETSTFEPKHVLIATDFETINAGFFIRLNKLMGSKSFQKTILYVNTKKNFMTDHEIQHGFKEIVNKYHVENAQLKIVNAEDIDATVLTESQDSIYDLLAITTHGRTGFSRLFFKSHADKVVNNSEKPVFTYNLRHYLENIGDNIGGFRSGFTG